MASLRGKTWGGLRLQGQGERLLLSAGPASPPSTRIRQGDTQEPAADDEVGSFVMNEPGPQWVQRTSMVAGTRIAFMPQGRPARRRGCGDRGGGGFGILAWCLQSESNPRHFLVFLYQIDRALGSFFRQGIPFIYTSRIPRRTQPCADLRLRGACPYGVSPLTLGPIAQN